MRFQDYICDAIQSSADEAFKNARSVPQDKVDWKPLGLGRSVLDQCRELAKTPDWAYDIISGETQPDWSEAGMAEQQKVMDQWMSVEQCHTECKPRLEKLLAFIRQFPDERLSETKWLPYDGGRDFTMMEMMDYPRWNYNYHNGQISYVQILYGDKEMH